MHSLETPRRFVTPTGEPDLAEASALASLRAGTLEGAAAYLNHKQRDRHDRDARPPEPRSRRAAAWHAEHVRAGRRPGAHRADRAQPRSCADCSTSDARDSMRAAGRLGPDIHGHRPRAARRRRCRRLPPQRRRLGVTNGARGRITSITARRAHARHERPAQRLDLPTPTHARARSSTPTRSPATSPKLRRSTPPWSSPHAHHHTQQWSYTALSRSRTPNATARPHRDGPDQPAEHAAPLDPIDARDALTRLATCMTRDESETERRSATQLPAPTRPAPRRAGRNL